MATAGNGKQPWLKFYPSDWRADPALRMCSIAARGLWMEMLCLMHDASPAGSLVVNGRQVTMRQLASLAGVTVKEVEGLVEEMEDAGVFSRDGDGTIFSRRMRRDIAKAGREVEQGRLGGNPDIRRGTVPKAERVRPFKRTDAPEKTKRIFEKDEGNCHWCGVALAWEYVEGATNFFHVDHVVAVCDGGTNDESNLVAACSACNHNRARHPVPTASAVGGGPASDTNTASAGDPSDNNHQPTVRRSDTNPRVRDVPDARGIATQRPEARGQKLGEAAREVEPQGRALAHAKRFEPHDDGPRDGPADDYRRAEQACIAALGGSSLAGGQAPADAAFGSVMSLLDRGYPLLDVVALLRIEAEKPRKRPIRTWSLWAEILAERLPKSPPAPPDPADPIVDFRGGVTAKLSTIRMVLDRGTWLDQWGPKLGESGCRVSPELVAMLAQRVPA